MKCLVLSLVFFFLLQLQCAQGASLAGKLKGELQNIGGDEKALEAKDKTDTYRENEIQEEQQDIEAPKQTEHKNTRNGSKQEEEVTEDSSLHESTESGEDRENEKLNRIIATTSSEVDINGESPNNTALSANDTLAKNDTKKRTLQSRIGLGSTIGGASNLNLGVGGSVAARPSTSTSFAAGVNQGTALGSGLDTQQTWPSSLDTVNANAFANGAIQSSQQGAQSVVAGSQAEVTTQYSPYSAIGASTSSTVNNAPTTQNSLNINSFSNGAIQNNLQGATSLAAGSQAGVTSTTQNRPSSAIGSSLTANNGPTTPSSLNTNVFANGAIQNNEQGATSLAAGSQAGVTSTTQNRPSSAIGSSLTANNGPTTQISLNTNVFANGAIQNNEQGATSLAAGSQAGVTSTTQNRPSSAIGSSLTANNGPTTQISLNTNVFANGAIQNNEQGATSLAAGSQAGVTSTTQNRPSSAIGSSLTVHNGPTIQSSLNTNAFAHGVVQNNQQGTTSLAAGSQAGVTSTTQNRPSSAIGSSLTVHNGPTLQSSLNTNAFAHGVVQNNQQGTTSLAAGSQAGVKSTTQNRPSSAIGSSLIANNTPTTQISLITNAFAHGVVQNNQQGATSLAAGSQAGVTSTIQNRPSSAIGSSLTVNNGPTTQSSLNTTTFANGAILSNQEGPQPAAAGSQIGITTTNQNRPYTTFNSSASSTVNNLPTTQGTLNSHAFANGPIQNNQQQSTPSVATGSQVGITSTIQNRPSTVIDSSASTTVNSWPTTQGIVNTNAFANGAIQSSQQGAQSVVAGSQAGVTTQNRPSLGIGLGTSLALNNGPTTQGTPNTNPFLGGHVLGDQQQSTPSIAAGGQAAVSTTNLNMPSTATLSSASSTVSKGQATHGTLNTNTLANVAIQNNKEQSGPSVATGSHAGITSTIQNKPSASIDSSTSSTVNNRPAMQATLNMNSLVGGAIQENQQQSTPSIAAGSHVGITNTNHNRLPTESGASSIVNNFPSQDTINTNAFANSAIQNNQQHTANVKADSQVGVITNQNKPSAIMNASTISSTNNLQLMQNGLNSNAFTNGAVQSNQQQSRPSQTASSQAGVTTLNRPTATINANVTTTPNNWPAVQGSLNSFVSSAVQNNQQQTRPSLTVGSRPSTGINLQTSGLTSALNNAGTTQESQAKSLEPLTKITQLMKVIEVVSNVTSANEPRTADNANINFATSNSLKLNNINTNPANSKRSLDGLTKIVQLLKVIEVVSNATSDGDSQLSQIDTYAHPSTAYNGNIKGTSEAHLHNGLSLNTQGNINSNQDFTNRPVQTGGNIVSYVPNYHINYIPNQTSSTNNDLNQINQLSQENKLTASGNLNAIGGNTKYQQFLPQGQTIPSTAVNSNLNAASSEQISSLGKSEAALENQLTTSGQATASTSTTASTSSSSGIKRRSLHNLVKTVELLDAIETLGSINSPDRKLDKNSLLAANTELQNEGTVSNLNLKSEAKISNGQYNTQGVTHQSTRGEETKHKEADLNASNPAQLRPTAAINSQQNIRPTLFQQNLKGTGSIGVSPNYQQQIRPTIAGETQVGIDTSSQNRPITTVNTDVQTSMINNIPSIQGNYNQYNSGLQIKPSATAVSQAEIGNNNQYRPNAVINTNAQTAVNNPTTIQGGSNQKELAGSTQYNEQQMRPSVTTDSQAKFVESIQQRPHSAFNANAAVNSIPTTQGGLNFTNIGSGNQYREQQMRPSVAVETQNEFPNNNQYRPNVGLNAATTINNQPTAQGGVNINDLQTLNQNNEQQIKPPVAATGQTTLVNNQYRPPQGSNSNTQSTINNNPLITQEGYNWNGIAGLNQDGEQQQKPFGHGGSQASLLNNYQSWPNATLNADASIITNNYRTPKDVNNMNDLKYLDQYNNQQIRPIVETESKTDIMKNNQHRPNGVLNVGTVNYAPTILAGVNVNDDIDQHNQQLFRPSLTTEDQQAFINNSKFMQNGGLNAAEMVNNQKGTINTNGYEDNDQQLIKPSIAAGIQTGLGTNQNRPNTGLNTAGKISNYPVTQGNVKMNDYVDNNHYDQKPIMPETESEITNSQYRPNAGLNAPGMVNIQPEEKGGFNMNDYGDNEHYNQMRIGSSLEAGTETGYVNNNQYRPNVGLNADSTVNNQPTVQGVFNMNGERDNEQYDQMQVRPSVAAGTQTGVVNNNQYRPNVGLNAAGAPINRPASQSGFNLNDNDDYGQYNQQQIRPSLAAGVQSEISNNQYSPNLGFNAGSMVNNQPAGQSGVNMNNYDDYDQYNQQQIRPSLAAGTYTGFGTNEYRPNTGLDAAGTVYNQPAAQGEFNINDYDDKEHYNQMQIRPSLQAETQTGFVNNDHHRPNEGLNGVSTVNNQPTAQGGFNINDYGDNELYDQQQIRPSATGETQSGFVNNQLRPNLGLNTVDTTNNHPTGQSGFNKYPQQHEYDQYHQQQIRPSLMAGTQSGIGNNQYRPNVGLNVSGMVNNQPAPQSGFNMNGYGDNKHYNELHTRPSIATGTETGYGTNKDRPNIGLNNNQNAAQSGLNINDYGDYDQYNRQQIGPVLAAETQPEIDNYNQYRSNDGFNAAGSVNNQPAFNLYDYDENVYNNQMQNRPSLESEPQSGIGNNPYRPNLGLNSNYDDYDQQVIRPPLEAGTQTGFGTNQYTPNMGSNTAGIVNNLPESQAGFNMNDYDYNDQYNQQEMSPQLASETQSGIGNYNQYIPNVVVNDAGTINNQPAGQGGFNMNDYDYNQQEMSPQLASETQSGIGNYNQYIPNVVKNDADTVYNHPAAQGGFNMNDYDYNDQYNKHQIRQPLEVGTQSGIGNYNQYRPNLGLNNGGTGNNQPAPQGGYNSNDYDYNDLYNQQQIRPSIAVETQSGLGNYNQYRPNVELNAVGSANNQPTLQGGLNMNDYSDNEQYNQIQNRPILEAGTQTSFDTNQYTPNVGINAAGKVNIQHAAQSELNINDYEDDDQYNEILIRPSTTAGTQTGFGTNQNRPNVGMNSVATINNLPTAQDGFNMNDYGDKSLAAGTQTGFGTNQYTPNLGINATGTLNNQHTTQSGLHKIDYDDYDQQAIRPSLETGAQKEIGTTQYRPNLGLNAAGMINGQPAAQSEFNLNDYDYKDQYDQQLIRPSLATNTHTGFGINQYRPNIELNAASTVNNQPAAQGVLNMKDYDDNQQQMRPSAAADIQSGFVNNNQYRPNAGLNAAGTLQYNQQQTKPSTAVGGHTGLINNQNRPSVVANTSSLATIANAPTLHGGFNKNDLSFNQPNEQQVRPITVAGGQVDITSNQNGPFLGSSTTGNIPSILQNGGDKSAAANNNNVPHSSVSMAAEGQRRPTSEFNGKLKGPIKGGAVADNQTQRQSQSSVNAKSQVDLTSSPKDNKIDVTTGSKDGNLKQTLSAESQTSTKRNEEKQNESISDQNKSLDYKNSNTASKGSQISQQGNIDSKDQQIKPSSAAETQTGIVTSNQHMPSISFNPSLESNILTPAANPIMNTYLTGNQILPSMLTSSTWNNQPTITEYHSNSSSSHSKLIKETIQNHTSEVIRNQIVHSTPTHQGQFMPNAVGTIHSPSFNPLTFGGASSLNLGGASTTSTDESKKANESTVQGGISSSPQSNESKATSSSETRSKVGSAESSTPKIPTQGNTLVDYSKTSTHTSTKEHKTIEESQNQRTAFSVATKTPNDLLPSVESHVDCVKKEPLSNGSISLTTVGSCTMHQEHANTDSKQASEIGSSSSGKSDVSATAGGSLAVNAIASNKNEIQNIARASSDASFNATAASTNKGDSQLQSSGAASAEASSKLKNQSQASAGLSLAVGI